MAKNTGSVPYLFQRRCKYNAMGGGEVGVDGIRYEVLGWAQGAVDTNYIFGPFPQLWIDIGFSASWLLVWKPTFPADHVYDLCTPQTLIFAIKLYGPGVFAYIPIPNCPLSKVDRMLRWNIGEKKSRLRSYDINRCTYDIRIECATLLYIHNL